ncbi:hypothetical protein RVY78_08330 [Veillonella sp. YH-vei2232]|jgi:hypothetical protein|uniref:Uncharacterized protein n=1 Tax=Veillonella absiana TaxID=3079305 RepID=A0ABU3Z9Z8_9FIRM|nr:hypothetical protein [Veillonella sp. YH-vei2232]MDV5088752.1 hypothetical protein [Veillonella sp. YH-vei2233]
MENEKLWSPAFLGYGGSNSIFYMTQYMMITTLPIIITSDLKGSAIEAGMAMTYFQIGTIYVDRLRDGSSMV